MGGVEGKEENLRRWMEDREERRIGLNRGGFQRQDGGERGGGRGRRRKDRKEGGRRTRW